MITFSQLGKYGRLGNQFFQYAALKGLSVKNGYDIALMSDLNDASWHGQRCLLSNSYFNINHPNVDNISSYQRYNQPGLCSDFDENFFDLKDNVDLYGFFQNLNYFHFCEDKIKESFKIKSEIRKKCDEYLERFDGPVVSVHVRRGDAIGQSSPEVTNNFISKSVKYFNDETNFLMFTGGSRSDGNDNSADVDYLKDSYQGDNVFYSQTNDTMMDLCLMTKCDHNIVSHDSTFSWWAAYLNEHDNRTVICPKFHRSLEQSNFDRQGNELTYHKQDFYPDDWTVL
tara:strand:+ start:1638 stop:2489 length:852 start_codon:yes stop_codon:yes gene_type:complete